MSIYLRSHLESYQSLESVKELVDSLECYVPLWGGRRWSIHGVPTDDISFNDVVRTVDRVVRANLQNLDATKLVQVMGTLALKNWEGYDKVRSKSWLTRVLTWIRQVIGNSVYNRGAVYLRLGGICRRALAKQGINKPLAGPRLKSVTKERPKRTGVRPPTNVRKLNRRRSVTLETAEKPQSANPTQELIRELQDVFGS